MSKNIKGHKWFEVIQYGPIFDDYLAITPVEGAVGIDHAATHRNRDESMIKLVRQYGEILANGMADPRSIGNYLMELAEEAEQIEQEIGFGYNR